MVLRMRSMCHMIVKRGKTRRRLDVLLVLSCLVQSDLLRVSSYLDLFLLLKNSIFRTLCSVKHGRGRHPAAVLSVRLRKGEKELTFNIKDMVVSYN